MLSQSFLLFQKGLEFPQGGHFFFFCLYKEKISKENLNAYFKNILLIVIALFQHYYSYVKAIDQCVKPISSVFQVTPR